MLMAKGLEKMFGSYTDPKKTWRDNNKQHISNYNQGYFQANKQRIYEKRTETRHSDSIRFI